MHHVMLCLGAVIFFGGHAFLGGLLLAAWVFFAVTE